ncbi:MAG: NAD kinase [Bacteroidota bacterium]
MQVVIYSRILKEKDIPYVKMVFDCLHDAGINTYVYTPYLEQLRGKLSFKKDVGSFDDYIDFSVKKIDFVITLGGDGTILNALTLVRDTDVPVLGINLGRLGFLASVEKSKIEETIDLMQRELYKIDERRLLYLESNSPLFDGMNFALNDCTILKRDTSSMITIHTYINGSYLNSYWADGLIISTPTGSTGYSLSCGGPIIFPQSGNFVITPVAPHNMNVRPIVISVNSIISFEVEGRADNFLCTLDSRFEMINSSYQLAVRKCDFSVKLVRFTDTGFLSTLREKLAWGMDQRNH